MSTPAAGGLPPKIPPQKASEEHIDFGKAKAKFQGRNVIKAPKIEHDQALIQKDTVTEAKETQFKVLGMTDRIPGLGSQPKDSLPDMAIRINNHRHPTLIIKDYMDAKTVGPQTPAGSEADFKEHFLTDIRDYKLKKWLQNQPPETKDNLRLISKMKEKFNQEAYDEYMKGNIQHHLYEPGAIAAEMKAVLKFTDMPPFAITDIDSAIHAIAKELSSYRLQGSNKQIFSEENLEHLCDELNDVMKLYQETYPGKTIMDMYVLTRDMARAAAYQMYFDKRAFTGSDHGVLHIFHNCEHGHHMYEEMDKHGDGDKKVALLGKIAHFYHDIGYSVGSAKASFEVMKDHPFIGAAFIKENKEYFGKLLGPQEAEIIEKAILHHAIVAFESDTTDPYKMVRFTTSNSDACAVTSDQKTQTFWRNHPETLLELAKLRIFITIFPETSAVLGNDKIINTPAVAMKDWLVDSNLTPSDIFNESNFKTPTYYKAYEIYSEIKKNLLNIASKEDVPLEEQESFKHAIMQNFNAVGADVVLKQYGAELHGVSVHMNEKHGHGADEPKWIPKIDIGPSELYAYLESCYSRDIAGGNIKKLLNEEYGAKEKDINDAVDIVGTGSVATKEVKCDVAKIIIRKGQEQHPPELTNVVQTLGMIRDNTVPIALRQKLNDFMDVITPKENKGKGTDYKDPKGKPLVKLGNQFYSANWQNEYDPKFRALSASFDQLDNLFSDDDKDNFVNAVTDMNTKLAAGDPSSITDSERFAARSLLTTEIDWEVMGLER